MTTTICSSLQAPACSDMMCKQRASERVYRYRCGVKHSTWHHVRSVQKHVLKLGELAQSVDVGVSNPATENETHTDAFTEVRMKALQIASKRPSHVCING